MTITAVRLEFQRSIFSNKMAYFIHIVNDKNANLITSIE
jgi:hypothetical protein